MSRVTRFAARDPGPSARIAGFIGHLREQGYQLGVGDTLIALQALETVDPCSIEVVRAALRASCVKHREQQQNFDALFDSYWLQNGRVREKAAPKPSERNLKGGNSSRSTAGQDQDQGRTDTPDNGEGEIEASGVGRKVAARRDIKLKKDLRQWVSPEDVTEAEQIAKQLGEQLRHQRSRRYTKHAHSTYLDLRHTLRKAMTTGGEPLNLAWKMRPYRPIKIAALCDVSGSMEHYSRPFLAFLAGMMRSDPNADAYLFHTRLVRITDTLRDRDALRMLNRLTLLSDGVGGGSKIGANLERYAERYARRFVNSQTVVLIFSDGYDSDSPEPLVNALQRLRKRGAKIVWLNPLKGWVDYQPVARAMAAALPLLDHFAPATTLQDLADLGAHLQ
ncbi:MAG: VWA domain-containing protein [Gammaproteobacteria bacterium]|nr:VWA domain-containing protein [Gammaproteobacteria bacterium]